MALNLKKKIWRVKEMVRKEGVFPALRAVVRRLRQGPGRYVDVFRHYDFALPYVLQATPGKAGVGTLLWFIPDFNLGSGGISTSSAPSGTWSRWAIRPPS